MKLTIISDTHGQHDKLTDLCGDVLIHCGDMFNIFGEQDGELKRMDEWFGQQDFDLILCTGGNHDFTLEQHVEFIEQPFKNAIFLAGTSYLYGGIKFYGAPWIPELRGQAFYCDDDELQRRWFDIPEDVDVLITHTPPAGIMDVSSKGYSLGCPHLMAAIETYQPQVHCFGHVHASSGELVMDGIRYVNAASVNSRYELARPPWEVML